MEGGAGRFGFLVIDLKSNNRIQRRPSLVKEEETKKMTPIVVGEEIIEANNDAIITTTGDEDL